MLLVVFVFDELVDLLEVFVTVDNEFVADFGQVRADSTCECGTVGIFLLDISLRAARKLLLLLSHQIRDELAHDYLVLQCLFLLLLLLLSL